MCGDDVMDFDDKKCENIFYIKCIFCQFYIAKCFNFCFSFAEGNLLGKSVRNYLLYIDTNIKLYKFKCMLASKYLNNLYDQ